MKNFIIKINRAFAATKKKTFIGAMMAIVAVVAISMSSCKDKNNPTPEQEKAALELYIAGYGLTWATIHVIPADTSELYFWTVVHADLSKASQKVLEDSIQRAIDSLWVQTYREGADTVILRDFLSKGTTEKTVNNLEPNETYTLLAVVTNETSVFKSEVYAKSFQMPPLDVTQEVKLTLDGSLSDMTATQQEIYISATTDDDMTFHFLIRSDHLEDTYTLSQMEDGYSFLYNPNEEFYNQSYYSAVVTISDLETEYYVDGFVWLWNGVKYILHIHCPK